MEQNYVTVTLCIIIIIIFFFDPGTQFPYDRVERRVIIVGALTIIIIIKGIYIAQVRKGHKCAKGHKCPLRASGAVQNCEKSVTYLH